MADEEAAAVVRKFSLYFHRDMAKQRCTHDLLNDRRIQTLRNTGNFMVYDISSHAHRKIFLMKYFAISDMLTNEIYIGNLVRKNTAVFKHKTKQISPRPKED